MRAEVLPLSMTIGRWLIIMKSVGSYSNSPLYPSVVCLTALLVTSNLFHIAEACFASVIVLSMYVGDTR